MALIHTVGAIRNTAEVTPIQATIPGIASAGTVIRAVAMGTTIITRTGGITTKDIMTTPITAMGIMTRRAMTVMATAMATPAATAKVTATDGISNAVIMIGAAADTGRTSTDKGVGITRNTWAEACASAWASAG